VVALIGVTMAAGVVTWAWSPIKFQADMGILQTFMFLWNIIGALVLTSLLAEALMVQLGIGVKVATLPVVALGVGIGVDYALYLLSVQLGQQRLGLTLAESYQRAVAFTGKVVALVGVTLAAGVVTWAWSPIKFQADMGILLTFMFVWNMLGALILIPALSHFLLQGETRKHEHATLRPVEPAPSVPEATLDGVSSHVSDPEARGPAWRLAAGGVVMTSNGRT
jgi:predicted RND superfamily exporter protein